MTADFLERIVQREGARHQFLIHSAIDFGDLREDRLFRRLRLPIQLPIFRRRLDFLLGSGFLRQRVFQKSGIYFREPRFVTLVWPRAIHFVVQCPTQRKQ